MPSKNGGGGRARPVDEVAQEAAPETEEERDLRAVQTQINSAANEVGRRSGH